MMMIRLIILPLLVPLLVVTTSSALKLKKTKDDLVDYCDWLGEDDIQGKKFGFLAGNLVYYIGGSPSGPLGPIQPYETIGLTHPFYHDLRSRGTGISYYEADGLGNDFTGWGFWQETKVAFGTIITEDMRWKEPSPSHMYWRPDKMIVEYNLTNPYIHGVFPGTCNNWEEGSSNGIGKNSSTWQGLTEQECWNLCDTDEICFQANYEAREGRLSICWLGLNKMTDVPTKNRCPDARCDSDRCYAKAIPPVSPVYVREEKFIASNDVVSTIITAQSDKPVTLEISGRSFTMRDRIISLNGQCSFDQNKNTIHVIESGRVMAWVHQNPDVYQEATLMYEGMKSSLSASLKLENVTIYEISPGVCGYTFSLPLDSEGVIISWYMNDKGDIAQTAVEEVLSNTLKYKEEKTNKMNELLNNYIPYFRCSDDDIVKVYYYLWSIYLMYYTQGDANTMQRYPHTQTAVQNFLGMHRFDAIFQIQVGSWVSPEHHPFYANGNVLCWSEELPYRVGPGIPANFGTTWVSGSRTANAVAHIPGAWKIYEHSGNKTFLSLAYDFYRELNWDEIGHARRMEYDSALALEKMAEILGHTDDLGHWNASVNMDDKLHDDVMFWEADVPHFNGNAKAGLGATGIISMLHSQFPREMLDIASRVWLDNRLNGFAGKVPFIGVAIKDQPLIDNHHFDEDPSINWYFLTTLYKHGLKELGNKYTLQHLKKYNMEWGIPVAPESRAVDYRLNGDRYSNFNAGKIQLIIEGIGGLKYSVVDDSFTFAENLPKEWNFMEFHVPVLAKNETSNVTWVKARSERIQNGSKIIKKVTVESNPFSNLIIDPWMEKSGVIESCSEKLCPQRQSFKNIENATLKISLP